MLELTGVHENIAWRWIIAHSNPRLIIVGA
jgi:hypothetical protein